MNKKAISVRYAHGFFRLHLGENQVSELAAMSPPSRTNPDSTDNMGKRMCKASCLSIPDHS